MTEPPALPCPYPAPLPQDVSVVTESDEKPSFFMGAPHLGQKLPSRLSGWKYPHLLQCILEPHEKTACTHYMP